MASKTAFNIIYNLHITPIKNVHNSKFSVLKDTFQSTVTDFQNGPFSRSLI